MKSKINFKLLFALAAVVTSAAHAQVTVSEPWVRATVPQQKTTGAFMQLRADTSMRLVSAQSPIARVVEIHEMAMAGNVMRMRAIPGIEIPAGQTFSLKPGSFHVMLIDLKDTVKAGDIVPITLKFEGIDGKKQTLEVKAPARPLNTSGTAPSSEHKH